MEEATVLGVQDWADLVLLLAFPFPALVVFADTGGDATWPQSRGVWDVLPYPAIRLPTISFPAFAMHRTVA